MLPLFRERGRHARSTPFSSNRPLLPSPAPSRLRGMLIPAALILTNISPLPGDDRGKIQKRLEKWRRRRGGGRRTKERNNLLALVRRRKDIKVENRAKKKTKEHGITPEGFSSPPWRQLRLSPYCLPLPLFVLPLFLPLLSSFHTLCSSYTTVSRILSLTVVFGRLVGL